MLGNILQRNCIDFGSLRHGGFLRGLVINSHTAQIARREKPHCVEMTSCEPSLLRPRRVSKKRSTETHRRVANTLLLTTNALHTEVVSGADDMHSFSSSQLAIIPLETQIAVFDVVAEGGVRQLLSLAECCKWMHFVLRTFMRATLTEEACRLACSNMSLLSVSAPGSYTEQFAMEMRSTVNLRMVKNAFQMSALHCASPHCTLALRAFNRAMTRKVCSAKYAHFLGSCEMISRDRLESTSSIRVAYDKSVMLAAAHDAPVAFVAVNDAGNHPHRRDRIVRVDAGQRDSVWSPHSDMAVSDIRHIRLDNDDTGDTFLRVCWMSASHDSSALLYALSDGCDTRVDPPKTYMWDAESGSSYPVTFVSVAGEHGLPVEPGNHGWESESGWFRKASKECVDNEDDLDFVVVFQRKNPWVGHSVWQYSFVRSLKKIVCKRVGMEASDVLTSGDHISSISNDVSGRWMGCRVLRESHHQSSFACMIDIDSHEDRAIFCCPKALLGKRFVVCQVVVSAAGDNIAMFCSAEHSSCIEVHKRISDTACIRLVHITCHAQPDAKWDTLYDSTPTILAFSPCGRFLVWRENQYSLEDGGGVQHMKSTALLHDEESVEIINSVRSNMPRDFCWRACGVWMRLRRGAVLVKS